MPPAGSYILGATVAVENDSLVGISVLGGLRPHHFWSRTVGTRSISTARNQPQISRRKIESGRRIAINVLPKHHLNNTRPHIHER